MFFDACFCLFGKYKEHLQVCKQYMFRARNNRCGIIGLKIYPSTTSMYEKQY